MPKKKMPSSTSLDEKLSDVVRNAYDIWIKTGFPCKNLLMIFRLDQTIKI